MLILGIDTSTSVCSLALYDGGKVLCSWSVDNGFTHSEKMMQQLDMMLEHSNIDKKQIQGISVSIGPGSFTGLRIGIASAKTMAYALKIPICGVSTLTALAYNLPVDGVWLSPLVDGQKGNVYQAVYQWRDGRLQTIKDVEFLPYSEALSFLEQSGKSCLLMGDEFAGELPLNVRKAAANCIKPNAAGVAMLGYERLVNGEGDDVFNLQPYYMKKSEAEILWEKRNSNT